MSFISSFDIISIVLLCKADSERCLPDPNIFLCIPASAAANPNGIKTILANGLLKHSLLMVNLVLVMDQVVYQ